jgi:hypothetical protein
MPWVPEVFTTPIAEARHHREATGANDALCPTNEGIMADEPDALVRSFAAQRPVLDDPRLDVCCQVQAHNSLMRP